MAFLGMLENRYPSTIAYYVFVMGTYLVCGRHDFECRFPMI